MDSLQGHVADVHEKGKPYIKIKQKLNINLVIVGLEYQKLKTHNNLGRAAYQIHQATKKPPPPTVGQYIAHIWRHHPLTLSDMGGAGTSMAWGGGQFDPHFLTAPGGLLGHVFFFNFNHYNV